LENLFTASLVISTCSSVAGSATVSRKAFASFPFNGEIGSGSIAYRFLSLTVIYRVVEYIEVPPSPHRQRGTARRPVFKSRRSSSFGFLSHDLIPLTIHPTRYSRAETMSTAQWSPKSKQPQIEVCLHCVGLGVFWRDGKPQHYPKCDGLGKVIVEPD